MHPASWRWPHIALLWVVALVVAVLLLGLQYALLRRRMAAPDTTFFWLLPFPGSLSGIFEFTKALTRHTPLAALALIGVPAVAASLTCWWALRR
jgi:hypothetical protein